MIFLTTTDRSAILVEEKNYTKSFLLLFTVGWCLFLIIFAQSFLCVQNNSFQISNDVCELSNLRAGLSVN